MWLKMNAQKQKGQTLNADSAQKAIDILKVFLNPTSSCPFGWFFFSKKYLAAPRVWLVTTRMDKKAHILC